VLEESDIERLADALALRLRGDGYLLIQPKRADQLPVAMSKKQAAEHLKIHPNTVTTMIKRGEIKQTPEGRIPATEIRRLLAI